LPIRFHHVNLASDKVPEMNAFYRDVVGLEELPEMEATRLDSAVRSTIDKFVHDGTTQLHLAVRDADLSFRTGHAVNPLGSGHIAFQTDDIDDVKARLTKHDIPFSDYGEWAIAGWYQIFFNDPAGNVVEIFQAR
jgi:catechol 2,3-dioxygenase-like lactoylglutathione lyase family enzyme